VATYQIVFTPAAQRQLASLDPPTQRRVAHRIEALASAPRPLGAEALKGGQGELRVRIGDWRIIYMVHDAELRVLVIKIGHRGDIYRAR
jgi:mRNA interferase RelE/StbE